MKMLFVIAFFVTTATARAKTVTAEDLMVTCKQTVRAVNEKGKWDGKHSDDIYATGQCVGFIEGWLIGIDNTILVDTENAYRVQIKWADMPSSYLSVADAVIKYLSNNPIEKGKPADTVLIAVLRSANLLILTPYSLPSSAPINYKRPIGTNRNVNVVSDPYGVEALG